MTYSRIVVAHAISLRDFVDMSSTGNILLGSDRHIQNVRQMIMEKVVSQHPNAAEIHVRAAAGADWHAQHQALAQLAAADSTVYVWMTEREAETLKPIPKTRTVIINRSYPVASEHFLIVTTPSDARSLIWWIPPHEEARTLFEREEDPGVYGVLMTDPDETRQLIARIHTILID